MDSVPLSVPATYLPMTTEPWVQTFRRQIRLSTATGWSARERRGSIQLRVEKVGAVQLPYRWNEEDSIAALQRIKVIFKRFHSEEISLAAAASFTDTSSSAQRIDWDDLIKQFRRQRPNAGDATWSKHYLPVLTRAGELMTGHGRTPKDGDDLLMESLAQWHQGSRMRQIQRRSLTGFLEWATSKKLLKACYLPSRHQPEVRNAKRVGYPIADADIIRLVDSIPDQRWRFAVQLAATYGLRPEGVRHLKLRDGELWCLYRKSKGGRTGATTEPRRLHAMPVSDDWDLMARLANGEQLPPLGAPGKAAEALSTYLRRRPVWQELKAEAEQFGEQLTCYSFRHRFAKECHRRGIPLADICAAMGHTAEVHLSSYARFQPDSTAAAFEKVLKL